MQPEFRPRSGSSVLTEKTRKRQTKLSTNYKANDKASEPFPQLQPSPPPTSPQKSLDQLSRDELVLHFRTSHEDEHFALIRRNSVWNDFRVNLQDMRLLTSMDVTHFQDTCNKSVAIYLGCSDWQYRHMSRVIFNYVYRRWYRPFWNDIYHRRYLAKFVALEGLSDPEITTAASSRTRATVPAVKNKPVKNRPDPIHAVFSSLVQMHRPLCDEAEAMQHARGLDPERHFILQPLFRALLILVDPGFYRLEDSKKVGRMPVFLVKTGRVEKSEDGLSEPVRFDSIQQQQQQQHKKITARYTIGPGTNKSNTKEIEVVKTSLAAAIDLVMKLEQREREIYGSRPNPYVTNRHEAEERNKQLIGQFGPKVKLLPEGSLDHEWVDTKKYPVWVAAVMTMPDVEAAIVYVVGRYRYPQLVMVLQEKGDFNDEELRRITERMLSNS